MNTVDQLSFQYPIWYLLICLGLGLLYAVTLYFRDKSFVDQPAWLRTLMSFLRFLTVSILSGLLLSPLLKLFENDTQQPIIVVAQDQSSSVMRQMTAEDSISYTVSMKELIRSLSEKYNVQQIGFGSEVSDSISWNFQDKVTDINQALEFISENYGDQNLGAVVMASDGIYNRGRNPLYSNLQMKAPLYTIALGDTTQRTDLLVKHVFHNKIAFLGDQFVVQADILGKNLEGRSATLTVEKIDGNGRVEVDKTTFRIDSEPFFMTREVKLSADVPGVQRYRFRVTGMPEEVTYANNVKDIFIEVIDGRQKILVLAHSPHPDLAALKSILELNQNYEVDVKLFQDFDNAIRDYNFVIFHQLPAARADISGIISRLNTAKIPRLFVVGSLTNLASFNVLQPLMTIQGSNRSGNEVQTILDPTFNLFTISQILEDGLPKLAPAVSPFGQYNVLPVAHVLANQKIGNVETKYPLIAFGEAEGIKHGVIAGEGIWKWKLYDYFEHDNHDIVEELISKSIQFLTVKDDKRKFRAGTDKNVFMDNESILIDAELYNNSYELITTPDVFLAVRNQDGNEFNYTFNRIGNTYQLDIGRFPDGNYRYTAYTDHDGQRQTVNGRFTVQPIQLESFETVADHGILSQMSAQKGGRLVYPGQISELQQQILENPQIKPIIYQNVKTRSIIHMKWIFGLLLFLICLEWFLRRYFGAY